MTEEIEEIKEKITSLARNRDKLLIEANNIQKQLMGLSERYNELSPEYEKVVCLTCGGEGYVEDPENNKKKVCSNPAIPALSCNGKGFIWLKKYVKK